MFHRSDHLPLLHLRVFQRLRERFHGGAASRGATDEARVQGEG